MDIRQWARNMATASITMLALAGLSGCAASSPASTLPAATTIDVVERSWHTDVCIRTDDADDALRQLVIGYNGSRFLCFGFGDRHYLVSGERGPLTLLSALLPGEGAILLTILRDTPAAAFGAENVVTLDIDAQGLARLRAFLERTVQRHDDGTPVSLGDGPYVGGRYFGATARYNGFYTCNTWTADALREAGLRIAGPVLFADGVMRQVRDIHEARASSQKAETANATEPHPVTSADGQR